jgi:putative molybdopterin biosynthesis protein
MDRWRSLEAEKAPTDQTQAAFRRQPRPGHDLVGQPFPRDCSGFPVAAGLFGQPGGLIALAEGKADLAGSHLWDEESDTYNVPFVRRLLPGKRIALVTLAYRRLGLILPPGNPDGIRGLEDLARPGLRFVNRQSGSGTRVWLDIAIQKAGLQPQQIQGYTDEFITHSAVAQAVAEGKAGAASAWKLPR